MDSRAGGVDIKRPPRAWATLRWIFQRVLAIYFQQIEVTGVIPSPDVGGRLFGANHVNGLVDPLLVLVSSPCVVSPVGKAPLWKIPVLRWLLDAVDAVPVVRKRDDPNKSSAANDEVFAKVASHLGSGGNILIFPEGTSHNEPHLVTMRSGAGRMLARAGASGAGGLTFQAVGLEFEARDIFRSRTLVSYGPVRRVEDAGPYDDEAKLASVITERLASDLKDLVIEGATWEERRRIARISEMFADEARDETLATWNAIGQRVERAHAALLATAKDDHAALSSAVDAYYDALHRSGLGDAEVARGGVVHRPGETWRAIVLLLVLPLAAVGVPLYFLPYQVPRAIAARSEDGADVASTYKLAAGLVVFPTWASIASLLAWLCLSHQAALVAIAIVLLSPFAALAWLDRAPRLTRRLRARWISARVLAELRSTRQGLMSDLEARRAALEATE